MAPARPLAAYGALRQVEGAPIEAAVILDFPDMASAKAGYGGTAYSAAIKFRQAGSRSKAFCIEGLA